jgi:metalloendopeptidase OMA1, mitochondrial
LQKLKSGILLLGTALLAGCATTDYVTGQQTRNFYSLDDDIALGKQVFTSMNQQMEKNGVPANTNPEQLRKLQTMVNRIAAVSDLPDLPYEVSLYSTNLVNAMAAPGGKIIVFEGLWDPEEGLTRDDDELAAVLAHEIAHVTCRHSTEAMTRQLPAQAAFALASVLAARKDDNRMQLILGGTFAVYQGLVVTHYSRRDEFEADRVGMMYMARAGYDPRAALRIWRRIAEQQDRAPPLSFLSTHPSDADRALQLESLLPEALSEYEKTRSSR